MYFCAFWLLTGPLLPLLSTFFMPDFITAYVFSQVAFCGPYLCSYNMVKLQVIALNSVISCNATCFVNCHGLKSLIHTRYCWVSTYGREPPRFWAASSDFNRASWPLFRFVLNCSVHQWRQRCGRTMSLHHQILPSKYCSYWSSLGRANVSSISSPCFL